MCKGYDKNNRPFTAFCLLTNDQLQEWSASSSSTTVPGSARVDLTKYTILYQMEGHEISEQFIQDLKQYCMMKELSRESLT